MMFWMKAGKGWAWKVSLVVRSVMTPVPKSMLTSSPAESASAAASHSRMGRPMLMALR